MNFIVLQCPGLLPKSERVCEVDYVTREFSRVALSGFYSNLVTRDFRCI